MQVECTPAKLVLAKTAGSCVHAFHSASTWKGKECKISGGAGKSASSQFGGKNFQIPLKEFAISYQP